MESVKCFRCKQVANETHGLLVCNYCNNYFHQKCLGLQPDRVIFIRSLHQSISPICGECDINTRIEILQIRITELRRELDCIVQNSPFKTNENFTSEVLDRIWRAKNIIVYNLPEPLVNNEVIEKLEDKSRIIQEILSFCFIDLMNVTVRRLGLRTSNSPRPLRVRLNREEDVGIVLRNKVNCTSGLNFQLDKTPLQRKIFNSALTVVEGLHQQGYNHLRLKFIRGIPYVLDIQQHEEGKVLVADINNEVG